MLAEFGPNLGGWHRVSHQLENDLQRRADRHFARRRQEKLSLQSVAEFETYRENVRRHFLSAIGGLPECKTDLKPRVTGTVQGPAFRIEKVLYESLPGFLVSSALYIPHGDSGPKPAVVFVHGHAEDGKSYSRYQQVCRDLAANGFVVFAIDPIGQGERMQYLVNGENPVGSCTVEHTIAGQAYTLLGGSVARQMVWDIIRGIDYLETRPEVDSHRIGITGNSGGGTQTCYTMMLEPRLKAAAPGTFVTSLQNYMETGMVQDSEQIVPGCIVHGPDHDEFLTAMAPKPVMIGAVTADFFPLEGSRNSYELARHAYGLYGREENLRLVEDKSHHQYSDGLRQAAVNFFKRHLKNEPEDFVTADPDVLDGSELWCTRKGQILEEFPQSRTIFDVIQDFSAQVPRESHGNPAGLRSRLSDVLALAEVGDRHAPILPRETTYDLNWPELPAASAEKIWFFSAPHIIVAMQLLHSASGKDEPRATVLMVTENGTLDAERYSTQIAGWLRAGKNVALFDPRGVGAVRPDGWNQKGTEPPARGIFENNFKFACDAIMLGLSLPGMQVFDLLRAYDYLVSRPEVASVEIYGSGAVAPLAVFVAALEPGFAQLTTGDALESFQNVVSTRFYDRERAQLRAMPYGILKVADLPALRALASGHPSA